MRFSSQIGFYRQPFHRSSRQNIVMGINNNTGLMKFFVFLTKKGALNDKRNKEGESYFAHNQFLITEFTKSAAKAFFYFLPLQWKLYNYADAENNKRRGNGAG
jgi:hypothetical protein